MSSLALPFAAADTIVRHVKVNRARSPLQAMAATKRLCIIVDHNILEAIPCGEGDEVVVHFFKIARKISDDGLEKEYMHRGLKPADLFTLLAVNEDDKDFADEHPNGTHWQDANGVWCYAMCDRWQGHAGVLVCRISFDWDDYWWFAGVPIGRA